MKKSIRNILIVVFIVIESILFGMHLIPYHFDIVVSYDIYNVLYLLIIFVFLISFIDYKIWDKEHIMIRTTFLLTLIADYFLTYLDIYYELSIFLFFLVQISYFILINTLFNKKYLKSSILIYICVLLIFIVLALSLELFNLLNALAIIYFSLSIVNIIYLIRIKNKNKTTISFLVGLILFLVCDLSIGLRNIGINNRLYIEIVSSFIWASYAPSQVILVLSLIDINKIKGVLYEENCKS